MSDAITLTKLRLIEGVWHGVLKAPGKGKDWRPELEVTHLDAVVDGVTFDYDPVEECWNIKVPVLTEMIADGVQTILIRDARSGVVLTSFAIVAGDALAEDIRAEMNLLRAELDMLKKAFRRHCVETMEG